jgi:hypothetical protein
VNADQLKSLAEGMALMGYELVGIKPEYWRMSGSTRKRTTSAYVVTIAPVNRPKNEDFPDVVNYLFPPLSKETKEALSCLNTFQQE